MTTIMTWIIAVIVGIVIGALVMYLIFFAGSKSKYKAIISEAEAEGEVIKKNKLLEVKEKFLNKKAERHNSMNQGICKREPCDIRSQCLVVEHHIVTQSKEHE